MAPGAGWPAPSRGKIMITSESRSRFAARASAPAEARIPIHPTEDTVQARLAAAREKLLSDAGLVG